MAFELIFSFLAIVNAAGGNEKQNFMKNQKEKNNDGNQIDHISDSDFETPPTKKQKSVKVRKPRRKKKVVGENSLSIRIRTSPKTLHSAIRSLNVYQRQSVLEMGFGNLLDMNVDGIPSKLGFYVVDNFDPERMVIETKNGLIHISKEAVHDMIGAPIGGVELQSFRSDEFDNAILKEWKAQFDKSEIRPGDIMRVIIGSTTYGWLFKLNFLVLFCNTMGECKTNGVCNLDVIEFFRRDTDFSGIDWCGYIVDCLKSSKSSWKRTEKQSYYSGPITFLLVCSTFTLFINLFFIGYIEGTSVSHVIYLCGACDIPVYHI